jgi:membrane-bound lytic murein transglycosylase D
MVFVRLFPVKIRKLNKSRKRFFLNTFKHLAIVIAGLGWSLSATASDYVDLLADLPIEDELVKAVELREAQRTRVNPDDTIWVTIRRGFGLADLPDDVVDKELQRYTKALPYTEQMAFRARMYLYFIVSETQKRGMPTELALLPFVESAFQPEALSRSKAAGLWQFLPSTGDIFDLRQSSWRDDRLDVVESTRAALDYLQYLHNQFEDWHLALAAYNCGEGFIRRAVAANKAKGKAADFMSLPLPAETARYVPKLLAIKKLIENPQQYDLKLPSIANEPYFVRVNKNRDLDLETAAQLAETDLQEFRLLNPSFNRPVVVAAHQGSILIPAAKADAFVSNLINWQATGKPLSNWSTHTIKKGESLKSIAKRYNMTEDELRAANKIPKNRRVQIGSTILVKDPHATQDIQVTEADSAMRLVPLPTTRRITYRVRNGDTLSGIAARFGVKTADIRKQNRLKSNTIKVGQRLRLTVREVQRTSLRKTAYRVKRGDTLYTIAKHHRTSVSAIMDENRLQSKNLKPGQRLVIPH